MEESSFILKNENDVDDAVCRVVNQVVGITDDDDGYDESVPKKRRLCRHPGCSKVIKSQGHCQRHGAKAKRCKIDGCDKQAQVSQLIHSENIFSSDRPHNVFLPLLFPREPMRECANAIGKQSM
jgi:hypothetical protein